MAAMGAVAAGPVLVPLNTRYRPPEAADILRRSRIRLLFTEHDFLGRTALMAGSPCTRRRWSRCCAAIRPS
ncbi:hypothetical protein RCO28_26870 [Streptomyces sp. LHD-70]|uniref:hypothetical protein n=1 Tax=Streptomyces sp. LHD-70 TaxID=3072140 RepID=UPI00280E55C0|nr:hypothetical protein [Streptomyces sp. LHD-70]MDQ8706071.1 hypothetical protein [Streptomyces sp. LHD-70]